MRVPVWQIGNGSIREPETFSDCLAASSRSEFGGNFVTIYAYEDDSEGSLMMPLYMTGSKDTRLEVISYTSGQRQQYLPTSLRSLFRVLCDLSDHDGEYEMKVAFQLNPKQIIVVIGSPAVDVDWKKEGF